MIGSILLSVVKTSPLLPDPATSPAADADRGSPQNSEDVRPGRKKKASGWRGFLLIVASLVGLGVAANYLAHDEVAKIASLMARGVAAITESGAAPAAPDGIEHAPDVPIPAPIPVPESEPALDLVQTRIDAVRAFDEASRLGARGDLARAAAALEAWVGAHASHPERPGMERQIARWRAAEQVFPQLLRQPAAIVGARIPVRNTTGVIVRVADGKIICQGQAQFGVVEFPVDPSSLSEAARLPLLQRADAASQTLLAPAWLAAQGNFPGALSLLRADSPASQEMRRGIEEAEALAKDARILAALDEVRSAIARQAFADAALRLDEAMAANPGHAFLTKAYAAAITAWRAQIASAPAAAAGTLPAPPAPGDSYPGLPVFTLSTAVAVGSADEKRLALAAQWAAATGEWSRHFAALQSALIAAANQGPFLQHPQNLDRILEQASPRLALEQARFIKASGAGVLAEFCQEPANREFINWLLIHPKILAALNDTIQPQDKVRDALLQWRVIWNDDPDNREKLASLAIACALVFDNPVRINPEVFGTGAQSEARTSANAGGSLEAGALDRFRFYRDSAKKGALRTVPSEMAPWELVWVVDAPVPESELVWAQKHVNYARRSWSEAYGHIRYRMDRATQGTNPYQAYTLAEIEKQGGICGDQSYFAAMSAKANGIPAMIISGQGDRGGHVWFGYSLGRNEWNLTTGRYADNYAAGSTRDPQTGRVLKEFELRQLTDPARRTSGYEKSEGLLAFVSLLTDPSQRVLATLACDAALRDAPKNYKAWTIKLGYLADARVPSAEWLRESARMRATFREFSDLVQEIDKREADYLAASGDPEAARKQVRLQTARMERKDQSRTDLILDSVFREVDLAEQAGDTAAVTRIFREALRTKGGEMTGFRAIADHYYEWAKKHGEAPEVVRDLISSFDRTHPEPTDDVFAMGAYRAILARLTALAAEQGLDRQQHTLERREAKLGERQDKLGKSQSKGADR